MKPLDLSQMFAEIYYYAHPTFTVALTHQSVRALQFLSFHAGSTVMQVARHLECAPNTASEILRRLSDKKLLIKKRSEQDERTVELYLTNFGEEVLQEHTGLHVEKLEKVFQNVPPHHQEEILKGFALLRSYLKGES